MLYKLSLIAGVLSATFFNALGAPAASIDLITGLEFPTAAYQDPNDQFVVVTEKSGTVKLFARDATSGDFVLRDTITVPNVFNYESHGLTAVTVDGDRIYFGYSEALSEQCRIEHPAWRLRRSNRNPKDYYDCIISGRIGYIDMNSDVNPTGFVDDTLVLTPMKNQHCMQFGESGIGGIAFAGNDMVVAYGAGAHPDLSMNDVGQYGNNLCHSNGVFDSQDDNKFNGKIVSYRDGDLDDPVIIAKGLYNPWGLIVQNTGGVYDVYFADNSNIVDHEEINRLSDIEAATDGAIVENYGYPCYQGDKIIKEFGFSPQCAAPSIPRRDPLFAYKHPNRRGAISAVSIGVGYDNLYKSEDYLDSTVTVGGQRLTDLKAAAAPWTGNFFYFTDPVTLTTYAVDQTDAAQERHEIYRNALFTSLHEINDELRGLDLITGKYISIGTRNE